jgi:hypothetical protein
LSGIPGESCTEAFADMITPEKNTPIWFPDWQAALSGTPMHPRQRANFERQIRFFLHYCKQMHAPASVELARHYLSTDAVRAVVAREPLRWFVRAARSRTTMAGDPTGANPEPAVANQRSSSNQPAMLTKRIVGRSDARQVPPPAALDQGGADWERDLIRELRTRGMLWRTEETYRGWAMRFAQFMAPRSPYAAEAKDVGAFLSMLAVTQRAGRNGAGTAGTRERRNHPDLHARHEQAGARGAFAALDG